MDKDMENPVPRDTEGLDWGLGSRNGVKIKTASRLVLNKCSRLVWIGPP